MRQDRDERSMEPQVNFLFGFLFKKMTPFILDGFYRPLMILDGELKVLWGNRRYYRLFRTNSQETEGLPFNRLGDGEWDIAGMADRLKEISSGSGAIGDWEVTRYFHRIGRRSILLHARSIGSPSHNNGLVLLALEDITDRQRQEDALQALSFRDDLTHLYNRRGFLALAEDRLKLARRTKAGLSFFFADVDDLKRVNDAHGHAAGDSALVSVARVLRETFRESDVVARVSGDEFVALMFPAAEGGEALVTARLQESLARLNAQERHPYTLSLSMGASHFKAGDLTSLDEMMAQTDGKLYELKRARKVPSGIDKSPYLGDYSKDE